MADILGYARISTDTQELDSQTCIQEIGLIKDVFASHCARYVQARILHELSTRKNERSKFNSKDKKEI